MSALRRSFEQADRDVVRASAFWYACGYNDHRTEGEPYIDPQAFAAHWLSVVTIESHPLGVVTQSHRSLQDTFRLFVTLVTP